MPKCSSYPRQERRRIGRWLVVISLQGEREREESEQYGGLSQDCLFDGILDNFVIPLLYQIHHVPDHRYEQKNSRHKTKCLKVYESKKYNNYIRERAYYKLITNIINKLENPWVMTRHYTTNILYVHRILTNSKLRNIAQKLIKNFFVADAASGVPYINLFILCSLFP